MNDDERHLPHYHPAEVKAPWGFEVTATEDFATGDLLIKVLDSKKRPKRAVYLDGNMRPHVVEVPEGAPIPLTRITPEMYHTNWNLTLVLGTLFDHLLALRRPLGPHN